MKLLLKSALAIGCLLLINPLTPITHAHAAGGVQEYPKGYPMTFSKAASRLMCADPHLVQEFVDQVIKEFRDSPRTLNAILYEPLVPKQGGGAMVRKEIRQRLPYLTRRIAKQGICTVPAGEVLLFDMYAPRWFTVKGHRTRVSVVSVLDAERQTGYIYLIDVIIHEPFPGSEDEARFDAIRQGLVLLNQHRQQ